MKIVKEKFNKNNLVERNIEGVWYIAKIEEVSDKNELLKLKYLDDDNIEESVPFDEVRIANSNKISDSEILARNNSKSKKDYLPRPLAGLIDDDYEIRNKHTPTISIHDQTDYDEAILMNGAENKLAAGGGLRALRYLKK